MGRLKAEGEAALGVIGALDEALEGIVFRVEALHRATARTSSGGGGGGGSSLTFEATILDELRELRRGVFSIPQTQAQILGSRIRNS